MPSYDAYLNGDLRNYDLPDEVIAQNLASLDK
jgi:hypothetical protein